MHNIYKNKNQREDEGMYEIKCAPELPLKQKFVFENVTFVVKNLI